MTSENNTTKYEDPNRTIDPMIEGLQKIKEVLEQNDLRLHSVGAMERTSLRNLYEHHGKGDAPAVLCTLKIYVPVSDWSDSEASAERSRRTSEKVSTFFESQAKKPT